MLKALLHQMEKPFFDFVQSRSWRLANRRSADGRRAWRGRYVEIICVGAEVQPDELSPHESSPLFILTEVSLIHVPTVA